MLALRGWFVCLLLGADALSAQEPGRMEWTGTVRQANGRAADQAEVELEANGKRYTALVNDTGAFHLDPSQAAPTCSRCALKAGYFGLRSLSLFRRTNLRITPRESEPQAGERWARGYRARQ